MVLDLGCVMSFTVYLVEALRSAQRDEMLVHITQMVSLLARRDRLSQVSSQYAETSLIAFVKPDANLGHIAVAESLRRRIAKYLFEISEKRTVHF